MLKRWLAVCSLIFVTAVAAVAAPEEAKESSKPEAKSTVKEPAPKEKPQDAKAESESESGLKGTIRLPDKGKWVWWAQADGKRLKNPSSVEGEEIDWSLDTVGDKAVSLWVLNEDTGNLAKVDAVAGEQKLVDSDFNIIRKINIKVTSKSGDAVSAATVSLKDEDGNVSEVLIDASDKGVASFSNVPSGTVEITAGSGKVEVQQKVEIERERKDRIASYDVVLTGDVETVAAEKPKMKEPPVRKGPVKGAITGLVIGLIFAVITIGAIFYALKQRKVTLKQTLQAAGLPVEDDDVIAAQTQASQPAAPPALDPDAIGPAPVAGPAAAMPPTIPGVAGPKLVGILGAYSAAIFPIPEQTSVVGRDPSADISLSSDTTVSRRHARIENTGSVVTLTDEGSSNGTFVNGQKITQQSLNPGDEVQFGATRFRYEA